MSSEGKCIIVSAPSGAGKTSIVRHLLQQELGLQFSVSATSRSPRAAEIDGEDYHFLSTEEFQERIAQGDFVEWEEVYPGQYYGTLRSEVERVWQTGGHVIFDVDVVGGLNLKEHFGERALAIFIQAPDMQALEDRLRGRRSESEETMRIRLSKAEVEMARAPEFDVIVVNDDLLSACEETAALIREFTAV